VEGSEVCVHCKRWEEGGGQPLPDKVPREGRKLELDAGWRQVCQEVLIYPGGFGDGQEVWIDTGEGHHSEKERLEGHKLGWRLASEDKCVLWKRKVVLQSCPQPVDEMEGSTASSCQLVEDLLGQQGLCPFNRTGEAKPPLGKRLVELGEGQSDQVVGPQKVSHEPPEGGGRSIREGNDLGKVPGLGDDKNFEGLDPLE
jgi:hypothetical protein